MAQGIEPQGAPSTRQRLVAGIAGGLAGGLLTTGSMFLGRFSVGTPLIPELMADRLFGLIPMALFSLGIRLFGTTAKYLAFWGMVGLFVATYTLLGPTLLWLLPFARTTAPWRAGLLYGAGLWAILELIGLPLLDAGLFGSRLQGGPLLAGGSLLLLHWLYGTTLVAVSSRLLARHGHHARPRVTAEGPRDPSRRSLGKRLLVALLSAAPTALLLQQVEAVLSGARALAQDLFQRIKGLSSEVTPNEKFYRISKNVFDPRVKASRWNLEIKGLVGTPMNLTYNDLKALPSKAQYATLECISNEVGGDLISNAHWRGVPLKDLLEKAGVKAGAKKVIFRAADGYSTAIPLAKAMHPDTILAMEMNGAPLPDDHGFPLRLINPGHYGMKNPKWITEIEVTERDYKGYWEARGWSDEAKVKTMSRIDTPATGASIPRHGQAMGGIAFSGDRGIRQVEVSFDEGRTWHKATVKRALGPYTWVLWGLPAMTPSPPPPGRALTVRVRAIDGTGAVQTAQVAPVLPDGASGHHAIHLTLI